MDYSRVCEAATVVTRPQQEGNNATKQIFIQYSFHLFMFYLLDFLSSILFCSFALTAQSLLSLYKSYAFSHYHHSMKLLLLLFVYVVIFSEEHFFWTIMLKTYAILLACTAWLLAPVLFNPTLHCMHMSSEQVRTMLLTQWWKVIEWTRTHQQQQANQNNNNNNTTSSSCSASPVCAWCGWWWSARESSLNLRVARHRQLACGSKLIANHVITVGIMEVITTILMRIV